MHVRLSAHESNTWTGAFAPPPRPFGVPAWITRTPAYRLPFRVTHHNRLRPALPPMVLQTSFSPVACTPPDWTAAGGLGRSAEGAEARGRSPGGRGRRPRRWGPFSPPSGGHLCLLLLVGRCRGARVGAPKARKPGGAAIVGPITSCDRPARYWCWWATCAARGFARALARPV